MLKQTELGREGNELIAVNAREREQARRANRGGGKQFSSQGSILIPACHQLNMGINLQFYGRRRSWHCHVIDTVDVALMGWCSHNLLKSMGHHSAFTYKGARQSNASAMPLSPRSWRRITFGAECCYSRKAKRTHTSVERTPGTPPTTGPPAPGPSLDP
jgi:hypothetical protein